MSAGISFSRRPSGVAVRTVGGSGSFMNSSIARPVVVSTNAIMKVHE